MAVARAGSPTGTHRTGSHSSAFATTIDSGADFVIVDMMWTHFTTCQGITGITCGGVAMTAVAGTDTGSMAFGAPVRHQSWVLVAPPTGSVNITPTFGGAGGVSRSHIAVQGYSGVDQTTPTEGGFNSGRVTSPTTGTKSFTPTTTTVADDYLVGGYHNYGSGTGDINCSNGTTIYESYDTNNGTIFGTADKLIAGSGESLEWTDLGLYDYAGHVFVVKASAGGGVTEAVTGQSVTSQQGSVGVSVNKALTGQAVTSQQGNLTDVVSMALTGQSTTSAQGNVGDEVSTGLTGQAVTVNQGNISAGADITKALTGEAITSGQGTLSDAVSKALTGQAVTASQGTLSDAVSIALTGQQINGQQGTISVAGDVTRALTGQQITVSQGTLTVEQPDNLFGGVAHFERLEQDNKRRRTRKLDDVEIELVVSEATEKPVIRVKKPLKPVIAPLIDKQELSAEIRDAMIKEYLLEIHHKQLIRQEEETIVFMMMALA